MQQNKILCLSGGGIKGIGQLVVLAKIEEITGQPISKLFSLIVGTSVGGLIAGLLTIPKEEGSLEPLFSAREALELFEREASSIFPKSFWSWGIFGRKYDEKPLENLLDKYLGDNRLNDTTTRIIMTANDKNNGETKVFDSIDKYSCHIKVKDVIRATTAAPTYFKGVYNEEAVAGYNYAAGTPYNYVDGGLAANRPGAIALIKMKQDIAKELEREYTELPAIELSKLIRTKQLELVENTAMCTMNFQTTAKVKSSIFGDGILGFLASGGVTDLIKGNEVNASSEVMVDLRDGLIPMFLPIPAGCEKLDNVKPENIAKLKQAAEQWVEDNQDLLQDLCSKLSINSDVENIGNVELVGDTQDLSIEKIENPLKLETANNIKQLEEDNLELVTADAIIADWVSKLDLFWQLEVLERKEILSAIRDNLTVEQVKQVWNVIDFDLSKEIEYFVANNLRDEEISQWIEILSEKNVVDKGTPDVEAIIGNFTNCSQEMTLEGDNNYSPTQDTIEVY